MLDETSRAGPASVVALGDGGLVALAQAALGSERPRNLVLVATSVDRFAQPAEADRGLPLTWLNDLSDDPEKVGCCDTAPHLAPQRGAEMLLSEVYGEHQLIEGCLEVDGRTVDLQSIRGPVLALLRAGRSGSPDPACLAVATCIGSQDFTWVKPNSLGEDGDPAESIVGWLESRDEAR
jgi:hypothetical protein